jgi:hypothetical protein
MALRGAAMTLANLPLMSGGQLVVAALRAHGVRMAFSVAGESYLEVLDALYDARGFDLLRTVGTAPDIGAFEIQPPPKVTISINDGPAQRSRVTSITIRFNHADIATPADTNAYCQLKRLSDNAVVTLGLGGPHGPDTVNSLTYGLTFKAGPLENKSLADGVYVLTFLSAQITDETGQHLDGNGDGIGGDDYVSPTTEGDPNRIFRLFGDANGDGRIDLLDFAQFRTAYNKPSLAFDFDGNGTVDMQDFTQFQSRYGMSV